MLKVHLIAKNSFRLVGGPLPYQPLLRSLSVAGLRQQSPLRHPASGLLLRPAGHQSPKYSSIQPDLILGSIELEFELLLHVHHNRIVLTEGVCLFMTW